MLLEVILFIGLFHKKKPAPAVDPERDQTIKLAMESVVAAGDLVYKIEHQSHTADLKVEADLIAKAKKDIYLSMNEKDFAKFLDKVDDVYNDTDQLLAIDTMMQTQDII